MKCGRSPNATGGQGALTEGTSCAPAPKLEGASQPRSVRPLGEKPPQLRRRRNGRKLLTWRWLRSRVQRQQLTVRQLYGWEALQGGTKNTIADQGYASTNVPKQQQHRLWCHTVVSWPHLEPLIYVAQHLQHLLASCVVRRAQLGHHGGDKPLQDLLGCQGCAWVARAIGRLPLRLVQHLGHPVCGSRR